MEVKEALFMNPGDGENSYARNSDSQKKLIEMTKHVLESAVESLFANGFHLNKQLNVADLGCATGPNTFSVISTIKEGVEKNCQELSCPMPELQVYLNDLPGNDFNYLFKGLSTMGYDDEKGLACFVMATPGPFHRRLFPRNSLHLVHSCYSVHWLSQVPRGLASKEGEPLNRGKIYISKTSPPRVREAYLAQFQQDLTSFMRCRSEEMVPNGRIVLILRGRQSSNPSSKESTYPWDLLAEALKEMVAEGFIDEEKLDSFNLPSYFPSAEEVRDIVLRDGSFAVEHMETIAIEDGFKEEKDMWARGEKFATHIRAFTESMIAYQFGEEILEKLFYKFTRLVVADLARESTQLFGVMVVLSKQH